ncbi:glucose 1-dehydrogenase [Arthrobacter sulfonylureivorans]|uniref:Glucose 1-dehydrogenase n=1 Tax=Arthrobacter sulfonylureivorans TaxID=2486855 RepID=A0ABY3W2I4_9MICC|nr:glucose 1-dehydrogenase [Arthrobacter sulfonylureivorans]UNK44250.1 glucose 1-dehydrogenase [Arthrobacter sulfonylureivorans]
MSRVNGKVALVTGGAQGIGAAIGAKLAAEGAQVVLGDILDPAEFEVKEEVGACLRFDVTSSGDWNSAVRETVKRFGGLDILVNNAGIVNFGAIGEYSRQQWDAVIAVNLTGVFLGMTAVVPALKERRGGSIINISSIAGLRGYEQLPGYTASKFGVCGLTKAAALDLGRDRIRVNSVHPGFIVTPMTESLTPNTSHVALGRVGQPEEVADLVLYLASDESTFVTGAEFVIDGGETAGMAHNPVLET